MQFWPSVYTKRFRKRHQMNMILNMNMILRGEWPSGLYSLRQVTEVKLGRVRSDFGWVTTEA